MAYRDFTLDQLEREFGLTLSTADLFPNPQPVPVPAWLTDTLARGQRFPWTSEKSRGEYVVSPILTAVCELSDGTVTLFSGIRMDGDPDRGLNGECDLFWPVEPAIPFLRAPLLTVVEAKLGDIEAGLSQCVAQVVGAQAFNARHGRVGSVYGCVTNAEAWQLLRLDGGTAVTYDHRRLLLTQVGEILAAFLAAVAPASTSPPSEGTSAR